MVLHNLKFDERGLVPTIVQDVTSGQILQFAYMNAEALALTLQTGQTHYWSQAQQRVWRATDVDGNPQPVVDVVVDCDGDAFIVKVHPQAPACHLGTDSCFHTGLRDAPPQPPGVSIVQVGSMELGIMLSQLFETIVEIQRERPAGSYTAHLFNSGGDLILKKLSEQTTETIISAKNNSRRELGTRAAELLYHLLVLMVHRDLNLNDILSELVHRAGLPGAALPRTSA
jgi:phosphoribosyl-ATP pyrophosphohydrolase/phosphoribosyl-AMP cyclohydrolase